MYVFPNYLDIPDALKEDRKELDLIVDKISEKRREIHKAALLIKSKASRLKELNDAYREYRIVLYILAIIGGLLAGWGFRQWQEKVQDYHDIILKQQVKIEESAKQTSEDEIERPEDQKE